MSRLSLLAALGLTFCAASLASGQTTAVRALALRAGDMPELYLKGKEAHIPLRFSVIQPGEVIPALRANPLPLYRRETNEEGEEVYVVDQKVPLPSGAAGILLLGWTSNDESRFVAIEDNFGAARFNDWLLINTGRRPVALKVGDAGKPVMVTPGSATTHRVRVEKGKGTTVLAQAPFDGEAKTFYSTYWPVHANQRTIAIFVDDGRKIRVKRIIDKILP